MSTLSERDETYVGDIVRDENWLKSAPATPRTDELREQYRGADLAGFGRALIAHSNTLETALTAERERVRVLREQLKEVAAYFAIRELGDPAKLLRNKIDAALAATKEARK